MTLASASCRHRIYRRTNGYGACAKNELWAGARYSTRMSVGRVASGGAIALLLLASLLFVGTGPASGPGTARTGTPVVASFPSSQPTWSNGVLQLAFAGAVPIFTIQSLSDSRIGVSQTLYALAEVNSSGGMVAVAPLTAPGVAWSFQPRSGPTGVEVTMAATLPVTAATGAWEAGDDSNMEGSSPLGFTHVIAQFYVNSTGPSSTWTVAYTLNVSSWPWVLASDALGLQVNSTAILAGASWTVSSANALAETSPGADSPVATFQWAPGAQVQYQDGTTGQSAVKSFQNTSRWTTESLVRLDFVSVPGGYSSLEYDPWITLNPNVFRAVAWVFSTASLEVMGGAMAVVAVLAAVAGVRRRTPPGSEL